MAEIVCDWFRSSFDNNFNVLEAPAADLIETAVHVEEADLGEDHEDKDEEQEEMGELLKNNNI